MTTPRGSRCGLSALVFLAAIAGGGASSAADPLPPDGQVEVKSVAVTGSSTPKIVVRAVFDLPMKKIWKIISDCETYKSHLPHTAASKLLKKVGNTHTCQVTVALPFPLANLTAITEAVHEESDKGMSRRWKLVSGDYEFNTGGWELTPLGKGEKTLVVYSVHAEPKNVVPGWIREKAQKSALPDLMTRLKAEAAKVP